MSGKSIILEIAVDRHNEKGVFVASQILLALHALVEEPKFRLHRAPWFRFEVAHIQGRIRFFLIVDEFYRGLLEWQLYAHYPNIEITEVTDYIDPACQFVTAQAKLATYSLNIIKLYTNLKDKTEKESVDPLSSLTSALSKTPKNDISLFHINFSPVPDAYWRTESKLAILGSDAPNWKKRVLMHSPWIVRFFVMIPGWIWKFFQFLFGLKKESGVDTASEKTEPSLEQKQYQYGYRMQITIAKESREASRDTRFLRELASALNIFSEPHGNRFILGDTKQMSRLELTTHIPKKTDILNIAELAGLVHLPTVYVRTPGVNWVTTRKFEPPHDLPPAESPNTPIGTSNFRGLTEGFWVQPVDRARHIYIIGKTGMGKSTLLENMIYSDILAGRGVGLIDPHGDLAETILASIPKSRTNDIVLFDPSDTAYPIAFNMLESPSPELRPIVGSGLVSIFKKMFSESWGPRLEYILRNTILTLLTIPDSTLISIPLLLTHESYRKKVVGKLKDPILVQFWTQEFEKMSPNMMSEAVNPILNKVGQFLSSPILRNILGQPKNPFSMRWVMDNGKIFIVNLSKGKIGEDASALLGAMMVTKFQIEAMTRADIPERDRRDFGLYVDEFQNFATDSFATILSEARKYKLSLTMANQYIAQMPEAVQGAVFGNVGSLISFQVGHQDAVVLADMFGGEDIITPPDLTNLRKYDIYTKLLINGMPSPVFSATTFAPLHTRIDVPTQQSRDILLKVSREKYTKKREFVEKKIFEYAKNIADEEIKHRKHQEAYKEKMKEKKAEEQRKKLEERKKWT